MSNIRRDALRLAPPIPAEGVSDRDQAGIDEAQQQVSEPIADLRVMACGRAIALALKHKTQFGALVRALLEHGTLSERQVLAIWETDNPDPGPPRSLAQYVPTHTADYRGNAPKMQVATGWYVDGLDLVAWREVGRAIAYLGRGLRVSALEVALVDAAQADSALDVWDETCRAISPWADDDPRTLLAHAVRALAGPLAMHTIMTGVGLPDAPPALRLLPATMADLTRVKAALGVAPEDDLAFERELAAEAAALLQQYRHAFGAFVEALVTYQALDGPALADVWQACPAA